MASTALRLRRALSFSSSLLARSTTTVSPAPTSPSSPFSSPPPTRSTAVIACRRLHTTSLSLSASRSFNNGEDQIDENTILFEGCDYKHWLIVMDFPKDPRPSPEEMVETYVQTLAKVVGSVEEAKKRMYACSTTTYTGFQAEVDEEVSQKFEGMPGVVFVLPDSYIDPVNKEYGGDKYINGTIIPRPPPVQYGRPRRQRAPQDQQGYPDQGGRIRPQPNFQQQNYPPPGQQQRNYPPRDNFGPPQDYPQQNYGPPRQNYGPPRQNYGPPQQNYGPPQQNFGPPRQGEGVDPTPSYNQGNYNQGSGYPPRNHNYSAENPQNLGGGAPYEQGGQGSYGPAQTAPYENGTSAGAYGYPPRAEDRQFNPRGQQYFGGQK